MRSVAFWSLILAMCLAASPALAQQPRAARESGEAKWIWAPGPERDQAAAGSVYFRKTFQLAQPTEGAIYIACQDAYELFVNGRKVGEGSNWRVLDRYDISDRLVPGRNSIAIRGESISGGTAGLVARVMVRPAGGTFLSYSSDATWRVAQQEFRNWNWPSFNDASWERAVVFGEFGRTPPWNDQVRPADGSWGGRFTHPSGFHVERVISPEASGSLVSLTFDEEGRILAVREGGPIQRFDVDADGNTQPATPLCPKLTNCHGVISINGELFAVGDGPDGTGLYRASDANGDGQFELLVRLVAIRGGMSEHGPHSPILGPDGLLYVVIGNHAGLADEPAASSPYRHFYEGDLVQPRYEDAGGHAVGVKAPGGIIIRTDFDGKVVERFAGGLRNAYDLAFNSHGELFTHDSDMEWDEGLPWYRPTRLLHVVPGAEFGWRSGWAKWPDYYLDSLPPVLETGRGSPTGMVFYEHHTFPIEYRGALFSGDWTSGRILAIKLRADGGTYRATAETFLEGRPLNVTDLAVGPDGWLYFCTGGRGTEGGVYRVVYDGNSTPPAARPGIWKAIRQPQFSGAPAREAVARLQEELGDDWGPQLTAVLQLSQADLNDRLRVLDLMHLYGPYPSADLLLQLSRSKEPLLRAKVATLMGLHSSQATASRLVELLADDEPLVRRCACEALVRSGDTPPVEQVLPLLGDRHRLVTWAAGRALQAAATEAWKDQVLESDVPRVFNHGAAALLAADASPSTAQGVLQGASRVLQGFVNDDDFVDLLRVLQLALHRGQIDPGDVPDLRAQLAQEYPALTNVNPIGGHRINRELVRLLVYLREPTLADSLVEQLEGRTPLVEQLHLAAYASLLKTGWSSSTRYAVLDFYEKAREIEGGYSLARYVDNLAREFVTGMREEELETVLARAARWPTAGIGVLMTLPEKLDADRIEQLKRVDSELASAEGEASARMRTGIAAVLGRSKDPRAMAYLRDRFHQEPDRRGTLAMALAQSPGGENWPLLIRALPVLEGVAAVEVLQRLAEAEEGPEDHEAARQTILCGLRLRDQGSQYAVALLEHWYGVKLSQPGDNWETALKAWQERYAQEFPDQPPAILPADDGQNKWSYAELLKFLESKDTQGDPGRGAVVFRKAQCAKCHRFGSQGEAIGPDLTTVSRRFQKKEVLESILFPSQVISDQYATKTIVTIDGQQLTGMVAPAGAGEVYILQSDGTKSRIAQDKIEQIAPAQKSAMPEGLFNNLTSEEIADLFAFLYTASAARVSRRGTSEQRQ
jgi:putative heme-binding domain-containing protein